MSRLRVVAVGEYPVISGFALAGVPVYEAETQEEAIAQLTEVVKRDDVGVVLAPHRIVEALPEGIRRYLAKRSTPIVLPLPDPDWSTEPHAESSEILDLLQRAIGYRVRLQ
jgi:vacuolar-type H+-ATPase subunit F/Vma7